MLGAGFLAGELVFNSAHAEMLTYGGALAMLANAWLARHKMWGEKREVARATWVGESVLHVLLALALLLIGIFTMNPDAAIPPDLAMAALVLTASIYLVPLFELPPLAQGLLIAAQLSFLPMLLDDRGGD